MSITDILKAITSGLSQFTWLDAVDILIIAILLYNLIKLTRKTRAYGVLKGIGVLILASAVSQLLQLNTVSWVLDAFLKSGSIILVIVILFQSEIRHFLEKIGRGRSSITRTLFSESTADSQDRIKGIQVSIETMSKRHIGALIVVEQKTPLGDFIATGTEIDGLITGALLENIFEPNTPLHDGAVIVRGNRIAAAGCFLPLSDDTTIARELGTRHRASLGISSVSDSITIVVSEETGAISIARDGNLVRYIDSKTLTKTLEQLFLEKNSTPFLWLKRRDQNAE